MRGKRSDCAAHSGASQADFAIARIALSGQSLRGLIRRALREDVGSGDLTSRALIAPGCVITAVVVAVMRVSSVGGPLPRMSSTSWTTVLAFGYWFPMVAVLGGVRP